MLMSDNSLSLINHSGGSQNHCKEEGVRCKVKSKHSRNNNNNMGMSSKQAQMQLSELLDSDTLIDFKWLIL